MSEIYDIFKYIPHERICGDSVKVNERFDIYNLGVFKIKNTITAIGIDGVDSNQLSDEIVELVELQAASTYRPHYHHHSSAVIYIVLGTGVFILGEREIPYYPGLRVEIPNKQPHGFITETKTLFLSIQAPPIRNPITGKVDLHYVES